MANRFNDGIIDLSTLREKKAAEKKPEATYNPDAIMQTIPQSFKANAEGVEEELEINVMSVAIMPDFIYLILHDGQEDEPPFLMIGKHENNAFTGELIPATKEDLDEYNKLVDEYKKHAEADASEQAEAERKAQLQEMLDKAESEEERQQILAMLNQ